jgi:hypothetical protein
MIATEYLMHAQVMNGSYEHVSINFKVYWLDCAYMVRYTSFRLSAEASPSAKFGQ